MMISNNRSTERVQASHASEAERPVANIYDDQEKLRRLKQVSKHFFRSSLSVADMRLARSFGPIGVTVLGLRRVLLGTDYALYKTGKVLCSPLGSKVASKMGLCLAAGVDISLGAPLLEVENTRLSFKAAIKKSQLDIDNVDHHAEILALAKDAFNQSRISDMFGGNITPVEQQWSQYLDRFDDAESEAASTGRPSISEVSEVDSDAGDYSDSVITLM